MGAPGKWIGLTVALIGICSSCSVNTETAADSQRSASGISTTIWQAETRSTSASASLPSSPSRFFAQEIVEMRVMKRHYQEGDGKSVATNTFDTLYTITDAQAIAQQLTKWQTADWVQNDAGHWVKYNPAIANYYALVLSHQDGKQTIVNLHYTTAGETGYLAIATFSDDLTYEEHIANALSSDTDCFIRYTLPPEPAEAVLALFHQN